MAGHARTAAQLTQQVTVGDKQYTLRAPPVVGLCAQLEAYIVSQREDPLVLAARACQHAPKEQHDTIWQAAMKVAVKSRVVEAAEMTAFENSLRGVAFKLWACLQEDHAAEFATPEDALRLLEEIGEERLEEVVAKVHLASGEADAGNSSGPSPKARAANPADESPKVGSPAGPSCTSSSRGSTASPPTK